MISKFIAHLFIYCITTTSWWWIIGGGVVFPMLNGILQALLESEKG